MIETVKKIDLYRKMKNLDRLNGKFKTRGYNLLEHSYMVAMLFKNFAYIEDISYDMQVFDKILHHDIVEVVTADLPWDVKNFSEITKNSWENIEKELISECKFLNRYTDDNFQFTESQYKLFKACDVLDLWIFLKEESSYGNKSNDVIEILDRCKTMLNEKYNFTSILTYMKEYEK